MTAFENGGCVRIGLNGTLNGTTRGFRTARRARA